MCWDRKHNQSKRLLASGAKNEASGACKTLSLRRCQTPMLHEASGAYVFGGPGPISTYDQVWKTQVNY